MVSYGLLNAGFVKGEKMLQVWGIRQSWQKPALRTTNLNSIP